MDQARIKEQQAAKCKGQTQAQHKAKGKYSYPSPHPVKGTQDPAPTTERSQSSGGIDIMASQEETVAEAFEWEKEQHEKWQQVQDDINISGKGVPPGAAAAAELGVETGEDRPQEAKKKKKKEKESTVGRRERGRRQCGVGIDANTQGEQAK